MAAMTWAQRKAIEKRYAECLQEVSTVPLLDRSGIYTFTRIDEAGIRHAYVGQAKKVLTRLVQHCMGYESHIDRSLRKHKFWSEKTPWGWHVTSVVYCDESYLDERERSMILVTANAGYQLLNKTSGGQDGGKVGIAANAPSKGYRDGLKQGRENARREIAALFKKNLRVEKCNDTKLADRAFEKWENFIKGDNND